MNGKEQVERYSTLVNSDQKAPASSDWQPDTLAGFRIGDLVRLPSIKGALEITGLKPPSLLILRTPTGATVQAGWRAVERVRIKRRIKRRIKPSGGNSHE